MSADIQRTQKIVLLSTHDSGGAGMYVIRIARALKEAGYQVAVVVQHKTVADDFVIQVPPARNSVKTLSRKAMDRVQQRFVSPVATDPDYYFFNADERRPLDTEARISAVLPFTPDLILAGWISHLANARVLQQLQKRTGAQVYMLMADMEPLTGGCHYAWDCQGYLHTCADCPAITDIARKSIAAHNLAVKSECYKGGNFGIIASSEWTLKQAQQSGIFRGSNRLYNINSCIDTGVFNDRNRGIAKQAFHLEPHHKVIFTGATYTDERRKGMQYFVAALQTAWEQMDEATREQTKVLIAGNYTIQNKLLREIPFRKHIIDYIRDERLLSLVYQASDVFVCSSIEDSGPLMVSEALACGAPVVAFEMGVAANMVQEGRNGYIVPLYNSEAMGKAICSLLEMPPEMHRQFSACAVAQVRDHSAFPRTVAVIDQIFQNS